MRRGNSANKFTSFFTKIKGFFASKLRVLIVRYLHRRCGNDDPKSAKSHGPGQKTRSEMFEGKAQFNGNFVHTIFSRYMMKTIYTALILLQITTMIQAQNMSLKINEIITSNQNGQLDDFFEHEDWVEIYNPPGNPITNLAGYYISDDATNLIKWQIPADDAGVTTMLPNAFIVLWIDNDYNNAVSQGPLHNDGFGLNSDGETFLLTAPDGITVIDSISYPIMAPDVSYGRTCDGCPTWQYFNNVTYKAPNAEFLTNNTLFINEVQTVNTSTYDDPQHEYDQWFEIYNPNTFQVNIAGYYLSVNGIPTQWQVPSTNPYRTVIAAGGFGLIWCDFDVADDAHHAPFPLATSGGTIVLTGPVGGTTIDSYTYGVIAENQSWGRQNDGSSTSITFNIPTPTVSNSLFIIQPQNLYINEVLSANQNDTLDNFNQLEDWFEVYNPNNFPVNLAGYHFSDDPERRSKWMVPTTFPDSVTVPAHGWLLFWADVQQNQGVRHAGIRLSNNSEYLSLASPDGFTLADEIEWGYIAPDTSYGRSIDGGPNWILFVGTTPEYSNNAGMINITETELAALHVYPNPAHDFIQFGERMNIAVYTITGTLIEKHNNISNLNMSAFAAGIYIVRNDRGQTVRISKY